jgi:putative ABC transport system permease protein
MRIGLALHLLKKSAALRRRRAAMTVLTVAWGTLSMVVLLAIGEGIRQQVDLSFRQFGKPMLIVNPGTTSKSWLGWPKGRKVTLLYEDVPAIRKALARDAEVGVYLGKNPVTLERGEREASVGVRGVSANYEHLRSHYAAAGGRFLNEEDIAQRRRVIFLGDELATELFGEVDPIGEGVLVGGIPYTVIGVLKHKLPMGFGDDSFDTRTTCIPITTHLVQFGERPVRMLVSPLSIAELERVVAKVRQVVGGAKQFDPEDERALRIWNFAEEALKMQSFFRGLLIFLGTLGALTLVLGGVSVANILFATVAHRSREIGVQMALGARRSDIVLPVLAEGFLYTLSGGVIGIAASLLVVRLLNLLPVDKVASLRMLGHPTISWPLALATVAVLSTVGVVAGYLPARRAAGLDPAVTLRYE